MANGTPEERETALKDPAFKMKSRTKVAENQIRNLRKQLKRAEDNDNKEVVKKKKAQIKVLQRQYNEAYNNAVK